jgi:hypothetical protein
MQRSCPSLCFLYVTLESQPQDKFGSKSSQRVLWCMKHAGREEQHSTGKENQIHNIKPYCQPED